MNNHFLHLTGGSAVAPHRQVRNVSHKDREKAERSAK
jgi:hypothetical protein